MPTPNKFAGRWAHERKPQGEDVAFTVIDIGSEDKVRVKFDTFCQGHQEVEGNTPGDQIFFTRLLPDCMTHIFYSAFWEKPLPGRNGRIVGSFTIVKILSTDTKQSSKRRVLRDDEWTANRPA